MSRPPLHRRRPAASVAALFLAIAAAPAAAEVVLPLDGVYGSKDGCHYHVTGDWQDTDENFLILPDHVEAPGYACKYARVTENSPERIKAVAICLDDPMEDIPQRQHVRALSVVRSGQSYIVTFNDGTSWGPLSKC